MQAGYDLGPEPPLGYAASVLDRVAELRHDAVAIAALERHPGACSMVIGGDLICLRPAHAAMTRPSRWPMPPRWHRCASARFSAVLTASLCSPSPSRKRPRGPSRNAKIQWSGDLLVTDLRGIATGGLVAPEHLPPLAEAKAVLGWHARLASAPIAARRAGRSMRGGGATARPAACSISRAPIPSSSCWRSTASAACSAAARVFAGHVVVPRRLRRARRDHGGSGAARDPQGGRHHLRTRRLFRVAAVAVPDVADDRLSCRGADNARSRWTAPSSRMRAGFPATRSPRCCCAAIPPA